MSRCIGNIFSRAHGLHIGGLYFYVIELSSTVALELKLAAGRLWSLKLAPRCGGLTVFSRFLFQSFYPFDPPGSLIKEAQLQAFEVNLPLPFGHRL